MVRYKWPALTPGIMKSQTKIKQGMDWIRLTKAISNHLNECV